MVYRSSKETQERKDIKKKGIIEASAIVFSEKGYHGTTVKDVVEAAEISTGTFYFYFKNKEELFELLYDDIAEDLYLALRESLENICLEVDLGFSKAIAFFLKVIQTWRPLARILLIEAVGLNQKFEQKRAEITRKYVDYTAGHFNEMLEKQMISVPDIRICALAFIGTLYNSIMEWLHGDMTTNVTDYAYALTIYNLQALKIGYTEEKVRAGIEEILSMPLPLIRRRNNDEENA